jgi:hypothetical protein
MDMQAIRNALHKQPFQPFSFRLADGRAMPVPHPDFVAISTRRIVHIDNQDDSWSVLEPLLIVSIDYEAAGKGSANGPPASQNE